MPVVCRFLNLDVPELEGLTVSSSHLKVCYVKQTHYTVSNFLGQVFCGIYPSVVMALTLSSSSV